MGCTRTTRANIRASPIVTRPITPAKIYLGVEANKDPLLNGALSGRRIGKAAARECNNERLKNALIQLAVPKPERQERPGYKVMAVDMCIAVHRQTDTSNIGRWFQMVRFVSLSIRLGPYLVCILGAEDRCQKTRILSDLSYHNGPGDTRF